MGAIELAVIPPVQYTQLLDQSYHLLLPELLVGSSQYREYYARKPTGTYRILDNGAAENAQYNIMELDLIARMWEVDEIALPDKLGDTTGTIVSSLNAIEYLRDYYGSQGINGPAYKVGIVAQGKNYLEALNCIDTLMTPHRARISVIYIPRLLVSREDREIRIEIARYVKEHYPEVEIHLFGMSQSFPGELALAAPYGNRLIRSIDTSAPYTYAMRGLEITREYQMRPITRPKGYFSMWLKAPEEARALKNIQLLQSWCARYGS